MSWRRRLLSTLRLAGVSATDVGRAGQLVSRTGSPTVRSLSDDVHAVAVGKPLRQQPLGANAWLVQTRRGARRLLAHQLSSQTWLVRMAGDREKRIRQLGPKETGAHLVYDQSALRNGIRLWQQSLSSFVAGEHAAWMLRELDVNCVLDVGANTGQFAKSIRSAGYTGRIVSFEPLPHLVEELRRNAENDQDWLVVPVALGEEDTEAEINVVPGTMSSMFTSSEFGRTWAPHLGEMTAQTVQVRRLDALLDEVSAGIDEPRFYLKMDTQGFDVATFKGAGDRIAECVAMQSEVACVPIYEGMPKMDEQMRLYEAAGFALSGMFPVTIDRRSLRVIEFDAMFLRPGALPDRERQ